MLTHLWSNFNQMQHGIVVFFFYLPKCCTLQCGPSHPRRCGRRCCCCCRDITGCCWGRKLRGVFARGCSGHNLGRDERIPPSWASHLRPTTSLSERRRINQNLHSDHTRDAKRQKRKKKKESLQAVKKKPPLVKHSPLKQREECWCSALRGTTPWTLR